MFTEMDYKAEMKANYKNGYAAGEAHGEARGEARGRSEGERMKAIDSATKLLAAGIPIETIASCVGLSVKEVDGLRKAVEPQ